MNELNYGGGSDSSEPNRERPSWPEQSSSQQTSRLAGDSSPSALSTSAEAHPALNQSLTWSENAIQQWEQMEPGPDATKLLWEIMSEHRKDLLKHSRGWPRRLRRGMILMQGVMRHEKRRARIDASQSTIPHIVSQVWPYGIQRLLTAKAAHRIHIDS